MWFGPLPVWAQQLADGLPLSFWPQQVTHFVFTWMSTCSLCTDCMLHLQISARKPVFDQMIVNGYKPGEGISSHVDLLKFDDGIAIISLGSPATMTFTQTDMYKDSDRYEVSSGAQLKEQQVVYTPQGGSRDSNAHDLRSKGDYVAELLQQDVYLQAGDVLLLHGEARYGWKHGIAFNQPCSIQSSQRRVSITLRKLMSSCQ